ncbi:hypothetical protein PoB_002823600 [Plakobranchus ocellatus]|uniref:Uncharacterized protein n=1 Tax=Plakobranchus ocellatus TaxID=259542 RepID=A0AAV4A0P6_9GAST|nr:hypothetical protein PoB_002823600 [Plakobranchus ocellatus]
MRQQARGSKDKREHVLTRHCDGFAGKALETPSDMDMGRSRRGWAESNGVGDTVKSESATTSARTFLLRVEPLHRRLGLTQGLRNLWLFCYELAI